MDVTSTNKVLLYKAIKLIYYASKLIDYDNVALEKLEKVSPRKRLRTFSPLRQELASSFHLIRTEYRIKVIRSANPVILLQAPT
jgi:hypothetical protein